MLPAPPPLAEHNFLCGYAYDLRGLQTKARFNHIAGEGVTTAYDGFGRVTGSTLAMAGTSRTLGHAYDLDGNRIQITHPEEASSLMNMTGSGGSFGYARVAISWSPSPTTTPAAAPA